MKINVRDFLGNSYNHGYIKIVNNGELDGLIDPIIWEGKYETVDNYIKDDIAKLEVVKWGIENNGIVIYVNYKEIK